MNDSYNLVWLGALIKKDRLASYVLIPAAASWDDIGLALGFKKYEIQNICLLLANAPRSYLSDMLESWSYWAPGDPRGSKDFATLEVLKSAVNRAGVGDIALKLEL